MVIKDNEGLEEKKWPYFSNIRKTTGTKNTFKLTADLITGIDSVSS